MYSSSLFQFYETRQRKLWKWWHIYKQHVILICWSALVAGNEQPLQTSMALSYGKIQRFKNTKVSITKVNIKVKITLGEPDWKPSLEHSESIRFPTFQRQTRVSIYSNDCKGSLLSHCFHCNSSKKKHFNVTFSQVLGQVESHFLFSGISRVCFCLRAATPSKLWKLG